MPAGGREGSGFPPAMPAGAPALSQVERVKMHGWEEKTDMYMLPIPFQQCIVCMYTRSVDSFEIKHNILLISNVSLYLDSLALYHVLQLYCTKYSLAVV